MEWYWWVMIAIVVIVIAARIGILGAILEGVGDALDFD